MARDHEHRIGRGEFLAKSAAAGSLLVAGGLATRVGSAAAASARPAGAAAKLKPGYAIGSVAADFKGPDQYGQTFKLSSLRGKWVLVDLCPWWCPPCIASARNHRAFQRYLAEQGVSLEVLSVVVDDQDESDPKVSTILHAEQWAVAFGLERDRVLHCDGKPKSTLRQLVFSYAAANGNDSPAVPTYVLIDPEGVIQDYRSGYALDELQATIASLTGKTLDRAWIDNFEIYVVPSYGLVASAVQATFSVNGTQMPDVATFEEAETLAQAQHCSIGFSPRVTTPFPAYVPIRNPVGGGVLVVNLFDHYGESITGTTEDFTKLLDLSKPITLHLDDPHIYRTYNDETPHATTVQVTATFGEIAPVYYGQTEPFITGTAEVTLTYENDGSMTFGPFTPSDSFGNGSWAGTNDTERASNWISIDLPGTFSRLEPFQTSITLGSDVAADHTISKPARASVAKHLKLGRTRLTARSYDDAATEMAAAAAALQAASANPALTATAVWVAAHVAWLAADN
jgi:cytochrome oxidase Cu insertion factor (SCO1/SenC/PrrC family)